METITLVDLGKALDQPWAMDFQLPEGVDDVHDVLVAIWEAQKLSSALDSFPKPSARDNLNLTPGMVHQLTFEVHSAIGRMKRLEAYVNDLGQLIGMKLIKPSKKPQGEPETIWLWRDSEGGGERRLLASDEQLEAWAKLVWETLREKGVNLIKKQLGEKMYEVIRILGPGD